MKKVIMYKWYNPDRLFGGYGWSITEVEDDWNHIYSDSYEVEVSDDFYLGETVMGEQMYFKGECNQGYHLTIGRSDCEDSSPYLVGGRPVESIRLKVIRKIDQEDKKE